MAQKWADIGYHFVICNGLLMPDTAYQSALYLDVMDGSVETGRRIDGDSFVSDNEKGAHTLGYNGTSIGICLIGKTSFTEAQFESLGVLLHDLMNHYGISKSHIYGHYQLNKGRTCPNFDVPKFIRGLI